MEEIFSLYCAILPRGAGPCASSYFRRQWSWYSRKKKKEELTFFVILATTTQYTHSEVGKMVNGTGRFFGSTYLKAVANQERTYSLATSQTSHTLANKHSSKLQQNPKSIQQFSDLHIACNWILKCLSSVRLFSQSNSTVKISQCHHLIA